jgi:hypothetical protein
MSKYRLTTIKTMKIEKVSILSIDNLWNVMLFLQKLVELVNYAYKIKKHA